MQINQTLVTDSRDVRPVIFVANACAHTENIAKEKIGLILTSLSYELGIS